MSCLSRHRKPYFDSPPKNDCSRASQAKVFGISFRSHFPHFAPAKGIRDLSELKLRLCAECLQEKGPEALSAVGTALEDLDLDQRVDAQLGPCLEKCEMPIAMALQRDRGASYVFSGVNPLTDAKDIAATCRVYLSHSDGWIEDARPCGRLRFCLAVRIPADGDLS